MVCGTRKAYSTRKPHPSHCRPTAASTGGCRSKEITTGERLCDFLIPKRAPLWRTRGGETHRLTEAAALRTPLKGCAVVLLAVELGQTQEIPGRLNGSPFSVLCVVWGPSLGLIT